MYSDPRIKIRNYLTETRIISNRLIWILFFIFSLVLILIGRVAYLQIVNHEQYSTLSQDNQIRLSTVAPVRGNIYDRKGRLLALNRPVHNLEIVPVEVDDMEQTLQQLRQVIDLSDQRIKRFNKLRRQYSPFDSILLKSGLDEQEMARFAVNQIRFPGVSIKGYLSRHYPYGEATAHFVGYVGRISDNDLKKIDRNAYRGMHYIGKLGIEASYEQELKGELGYEYIEANAHGQTMRVISRTAPVAGRDLHLTLDVALQKAAMRALGEEKGAVVALEPTTGDVLAFASTPSYDANLFVNGIDHANYNRLRNDERRPLLNRAYNGRYAPGSTIKGLVGLAALESGVPADKQVFGRGWFSFPNSSHKYRCWRRGGHGFVNLHSAIEQSCDVYFYEVSLGLGIEGIHDFLTRYGLGRRTGIDLNDEPTALVPSKKWKANARGEAWYKGETVIAAIGQGYMLATPLQLAVSTATVANRGAYLKPRLVQGFGNPSDASNYQGLNVATPVLNEQADAHFEEVIGAMKAVVHGNKGTARRIKSDDYTIAGKTGTAQVVGIAQNKRYDANKLAKKYHDHALFVAFAPVEDPQIAVAVIVENGGSGSKTAAPIARAVMDYYFENKHLPGDYDDFYVQNINQLEQLP